MNLLIKQQLVEINTGHLSSISGRSRSSSSKSDDSNKASDEDTDYVEDKSPRTRGLKQKTKLVIKRIKSYAKENNIKIPYITSAFRGSEDQARVMFNNWKRQGGKADGKGTAYLVGLYANDDLAEKIGISFEETGEYRKAARLLKKNPVSSHATGEAFDLRSKGHPDVKSILDAVKAEFAEKGITVKIGDETNMKAPHWHINVK